MYITMGIDVSKASLDAYCSRSRRHVAFENSDRGTRDLISWMAKNEIELAVFEATGAYHRRLELALSKAQMPFAKVNPRQARRFAEAVGCLAKQTEWMRRSSRALVLSYN